VKSKVGLGRVHQAQVNLGAEAGLSAYEGDLNEDENKGTIVKKKGV